MIRVSTEGRMLHLAIGTQSMHRPLISQKTLQQGLRRAIGALPAHFEKQGVTSEQKDLCAQLEFQDVPLPRHVSLTSSQMFGSSA
jgi:hypothetical protein